MVYEPATRAFKRIDFTLWPNNGTLQPETKNERKLTQSDETCFDEGLGTMQFEPITIEPTL